MLARPGINAHGTYRIGTLNILGIKQGMFGYTFDSLIPVRLDRFDRNASFQIWIRFWF